MAPVTPVPIGTSPTGAPCSPAVRLGPLLLVSGHVGTSPGFAPRIEEARAKGEPATTHFPARTRRQAGRLPFDTAVEMEAIACVPGASLEGAGASSEASR